MARQLYCSSIYICNTIKNASRKEKPNRKRDQKCTLWIKFCDLFFFLKKRHVVYMYTGQQLLSNWPLWKKGEVTLLVEMHFSYFCHCGEVHCRELKIT